MSEVERPDRVESAAAVDVVESSGASGAGNVSSEFDRSGVLRRLGALSINPRRALVMLAIVVFLAVTLVVPIRTYLGQRAEFNRLQAQNAQLSREIGEYQQKVTEQNDPAWIENQARQRLQLVKPGETPVVLTFPDRDKQQAAEKKADEYAANPWYQNLWDAVSTPPEGK
ncbi:MAG: septum formation initiator family protein [Gordonia sp. (in: high G+C Gram-positive bacteria)]